MYFRRSLLNLAMMIGLLLSGQIEALALNQEIILLTPSDPICKIQLPSNPSTGYSWSVESYNDKLLQLNSHNYVKPDVNRPGAAGYEVWQFEASEKTLKTGPYITFIKMNYARAWELAQGKPPASSRVFKVIIENEVW